MMSKKKKKPLMAMVSSAYFKIYTKNFLTFRKGAIGKSRYACRKCSCTVRKQATENKR